MRRKNSITTRRLWEKTFGKIPKDSDGRSYELHHLDGNHKNNNMNNLICISIKEHYDIHLGQGDWAACLLIAQRMNRSPKELGELSRKAQLKRIKEGTHHFLSSQYQRNINLMRSAKGTNPFQSRELRDRVNKKRIEDGTHNFLSEYVYTLISPEGKKHIIESGFTKFCKDNKLATGHLSNVASGLKSTHKGWKATRELK